MRSSHRRCIEHHSARLLLRLCGLCRALAKLLEVGIIRGELLLNEELSSNVGVQLERGRWFVGGSSAEVEVVRDILFPGSHGIERLPDMYAWCSPELDLDLGIGLHGGKGLEGLFGHPNDHGLLRFGLTHLPWFRRAM